MKYLLILRNYFCHFAIISKRRLKPAATLLLLILSLTALGYEELPDLGEYSATLLSPQKQKQLGKEFIKEIRENVPILDDPIINDYITNLGNKLVSHANGKNRKFHFFIVKSSMINAFAGPDSYIGINSGTITTVKSESELAAVMSHEIAHVTQHHIERLIDTAKTTQITALASTLAAIVIGSLAKSDTTGNLASGVITSSMGGAVQHMINFTKQHEIEADNIGMKILYNSNFDPNAMPSFFERMQRSTYSYVNEAPQFLLTHPVTNDRIAESKNRANQYNYPFKEKQSQTTFDLIRARTQAITDGGSRGLADPLNSQARHRTPRDDKFVALLYGRAIVLYQKHQVAAASSITAQLRKNHPHEILFQMLEAQLAVANKQLDSALNILKTTITQYPNYYPVAIQYAQTLVTAQHYAAACEFIKAKIRQYPEEADLYRLLATASAQNNKKADAYQAKAKAYELDGYNRQAITLLQQALKVPQLSTSDYAIINARIDRLKKIEKDL